MGRVITKFLVVLAIFAMIGGAAWAASVHFKRPAPTATDGGLTLTVAGSLSGLGNADVFVNLSASAQPTAICSNQGGNEAPGQNPATVNVTGSVAIPASEIQNGNVSFTVTTQPPAQPTAEEAGCPNDNWSARITDMSFTSLTLTVVQNSQVVLTTGTITFGPTENGDVITLPLK